MNAPALNLFASPQGAAPVAGAAPAATGVLGVFEALLASLTGETQDQAVVVPDTDTDDAEPATDASAAPMMFAALFTPPPAMPIVAPTQTGTQEETTAAPAAPVIAPTLPDATLLAAATPEAPTGEQPAAPQATEAAAANAQPQSLTHDPKPAPDRPVQAAAPQPVPASPQPPAAAPVVQAAQTPPPVQAEQAAPLVQAAAPVEAKPAKPDAKPARTEAKAAAPQPGISLAATADADEPVAPASSDEPGIELADSDLSAAPAPADLPEAPLDAKPQPASAASTAAPVATAALAVAAHAAPAPVRGAPETMAKLAAGMLEKLDSGATRFEIGLDPLGLGHVDVSMEIAADGTLTAQLAFDTPQAAAELRGRSGELRQALEQAGFELSKNSLSFDVANQGQQQQRHDPDRQPGRNARAFEALAAADDIAPATPDRRRISGVDIRI